LKDTHHSNHQIPFTQTSNTLTTVIQIQPTQSTEAAATAAAPGTAAGGARGVPEARPQQP